jgi:hypothetical protein
MLLVGVIGLIFWIIWFVFKVIFMLACVALPVFWLYYHLKGRKASLTTISWSCMIAFAVCAGVWFSVLN